MLPNQQISCLSFSFDEKSPEIHQRGVKIAERVRNLENSKDRRKSTEMLLQLYKGENEGQLATKCLKMKYHD